MQLDDAGGRPAQRGWWSARGLWVSLAVVALLLGGGLLGFLSFLSVPGGGGVGSAMGSLIAVVASIIALVGMLVAAGIVCLVWWLARKRAPVQLPPGRDSTR